MKDQSREKGLYRVTTDDIVGGTVHYVAAYDMTDVVKKAKGYQEREDGLITIEELANFEDVEGDNVC